MANGAEFHFPAATAVVDGAPLRVTHDSARPSRVAVILQPSYLPWLGYFEQLHRSDVFVVYDSVQFDKDSWRNRNRIKAAAGTQWLTVPVLTSGRQRPTNRDIEIDNSGPWRRKHLRALQQCYSRAPHFDDYVGLFAGLYERPWRFLIDLNLASLELVTRLLGLHREIRLASEMALPGRRTSHLVEICKAVGADGYYNGAAGESYIEPELFAAAGIALEFQDYPHPSYPQRHGAFVPYLSVVDLLFNAGPQSLSVITAGHSRKDVACAS